MEGKQSGCGRLRGRKAVWWLSPDGVWGGVDRIVTISDYGFDTRAGMTGKCMGGGSISY